MSNYSNNIRSGKPGTKSASKRSKSLFAYIESLIRLDQLFEKGLPVRYLPRILFLAMLCIFYISNGHFGNKTIIRLNQTKNEVADLRVDYTTLKAEYMLAGKQSEVARKVAVLGLEESQSPPLKLITDE